MRSGALIYIWLCLLILNACRSGENPETGEFVPDAGYVQIVMFHLERRCESCEAVERETRNLLEEEYREEMQKGSVKFIALDFQSEKGRKTAELLQATGQTLFVMMGDSRSDLTSAAFMFASTDPEFYRNALRKELDTFLK